MAGTAFVLLLVAVGSLFLNSEHISSEGNLAGIVLDENDQPFIQGVDVYIPELDMKLKSNAEGFFKTGPIAAGTYKVIYSYKGTELGTEYATVTTSKISMMALRPTLFEEQVPSQVNTNTKQTQQFSSVQTESTQKTKPKTKARKPKKSRKKKTTKQSKYASLDLQTNIRNAQISLDGKSIGVGDLTYNNLQPGEHRYTVSSDGYEPVTGIISLSRGKTTSLSIEMVVANDIPEQQQTGPDYYQLGMEAAQNHQNETALSYFTKMIDEQPDHASAYIARGDIYSMDKNWQSALNDYLSAGLILRENGDYQSATTAYNSAIKINKKSVVAHIGRGDCFLAENEPRAAIMDYEAALKYDKHSVEAYFGLGLARFNQGSYKKASKHFEDARTLDTGNPEVYEYLILCYSATQDEKNLRKSFERYAQIASAEELAQMRADSKFENIWTVLENE